MFSCGKELLVAEGKYTREATPGQGLAVQVSLTGTPLSEGNAFIPGTVYSP
jgi:hypothetical protein